MPAEEKTAQEIKARPSFDVTRLKTGTKALIESTNGTLYTISIVTPEEGLIEVYSVDPVFQPHPPKKAKFLGSQMNRACDPPGDVFPNLVVKGARMMFKFADANFLTEPVTTALLEGEGWHYEAIQ